MRKQDVVRVCCKWVRYILAKSKLYWTLQVKVCACCFDLERMKKVFEIFINNLPDMEISKIATDMEMLVTLGVELEKNVWEIHWKHLRISLFKYIIVYCSRGNILETN